MIKLHRFGLDYLWWGVAIGGRHYTADLRFDDPVTGERKAVEMRRKISRKEAKELSETQEMLWMRRDQRDTNKFDTLRTLENHAARWIREKYPDTAHWILLLHENYGIHWPVACKGYLEGPRFEFMRMMEKKWYKLENYQRTNEVMDSFYSIWDQVQDPDRPFNG